MKKMIGVSALIAGAMLSVSPAWADAAAQKKAEQEVTKLVHDVMAAYASTDVDKYFSYYADDMDKCCGGGIWATKQAYYTSWKAGVERTGGLSKAEASDVRVQASPQGDAAVAAFQMHTVRKNPAAGQAPESFYNFTQVWMRRAGKWEIVNITYMPDEKRASGPATVAAGNKMK